MTDGQSAQRRADLAMWGSIGGLTLAARRGGVAAAAPARAGFMQKFLNEADPRGELTEAERERRARFLLRIHMKRLALRSARRRRNRTN